MRYAIIIEGSEVEYSAYAPDLPGCVAAGETLNEISQKITKAIRFHIEGLQIEGYPIPPPSIVIDYIEVA